MPQPVTSESRAEQMLNEPVNRVIPRLAVPTIISMLITAVYNMSDTYFVSRISTEASAAVGVVFSAMSIIQAFAFTIGIGSGANMSRALGAKKEKEAETFVSVAFFTAFTAGLILMVLANSHLESLVRFLGATGEIVPHAEAYATYIFYAAPFMMCSFVMNNLLRFQGLAAFAMIGITSGGILNMILDPIFIFGLKLGTAGAAIATGISQCVSFSILLGMCNLRKETISVTHKNFRPSISIYGRIFYNGMPSFGRQGIASAATILLNRVAGGISPDSATVSATIATMSIVNRFVLFINSAVIGFGQGFQPVCAFCWGARRIRRVREAFWFCVKVSTFILFVLAGVSFGFARTIICFFRAEDPLVVEIGTRALRLQLLTLPLWGFYTMTNMCTQSIGFGGQALLVSCARQGIFLIPALLILPQTLGILGLQLSQPAADLCAFLFSAVVMSSVLRKMWEAEERNLG